ncbi:hypothetical protein AXZ77_2533 [Thioclava sp. ES.031]|uniref:hypothetical protein n=1 Tax=unclassified Thioclava TaxID=2621713 RepID=UPI000BF3D76E|nr:MULTISPECIES: hypothetical protein [unclassified Thioclava]MPQ94916.1 hypothetical protein [Thioclava sp. JE_KL1]PFG63910.1 hypothetical protein AXZ77_2533 [Thioclava sp. ES.031]
MANTPSTTRIRANEDACFKTPILMLFPEFLKALLAVVERERELRHVDYWDPAYSAWLTAAEKAQDHVLDLQMAILDEEPRVPVERSLRLSVYLFKLAQAADSGHKLAAFRRLVRERSHDFLIVEETDFDRLCNDRIEQVLRTLDSFMSLELIDEVAAPSAH